MQHWFPDYTNLNIQKWLEAITLPTVNVKTCTATNATIVIMTTEIINLVLLVLMAMWCTLWWKYTQFWSPWVQFSPSSRFWDGRPYKTDGVARWSSTKTEANPNLDGWEVGEHLTRSTGTRRKKQRSKWIKGCQEKTLNCVKLKPTKLSWPGQDFTLTHLNKCCFPVAFKF